MSSKHRLLMNTVRSRQGHELASIGNETRTAPAAGVLLHSIPDAGLRLGVSESTIWRMIRDQLIVTTHIRRRTMIAEVELQRYVAQAAAASPTEVAALRSAEATISNSRSAGEFMDNEMMEYLKYLKNRVW